MRAAVERLQSARDVYGWPQVEIDLLGAARRKNQTFAPGPALAVHGGQIDALTVKGQAVAPLAVAARRRCFDAVMVEANQSVGQRSTNFVADQTRDRDRRRVYGSGRQVRQHRARIALEASVEVVRTAIPGIAVVKIPQGDESDFAALETPVHIAANLRLRTRVAPDPYFVELANKVIVARPVRTAQQIVGIRSQASQNRAASVLTDEHTVEVKPHTIAGRDSGNVVPGVGAENIGDPDQLQVIPAQIGVELEIGRI